MSASGRIRLYKGLTWRPGRWVAGWVVSGSGWRVGGLDRMFYGLGVTWESIDRVVRKTGIAQGCKKTGTYSIGVFCELGYNCLFRLDSLALVR